VNSATGRSCSLRRGQPPGLLLGTSVAPSRLFLKPKGFRSTFINGIEFEGESPNMEAAWCEWKPSDQKRSVVKWPKNGKTYRLTQMVRRNISLGLAGLRSQMGLISRLLIRRQDSFSTFNGTHLGLPEKQKAPETLGCRGFVRKGSGRYRT
jgi:hypothetical protein